MPCHPARAKELLDKGKAAVFRRQPFTIILKDREGGEVQPLAFKVDPGAKTTGIALVADFKRGKCVVWAAELEHKGSLIRNNLLRRASLRKNRRSRKTRYRPPRFLNRRKPKGWLPPSLTSRIDNISNWLAKLRRLAPISKLSQELVRFDTQLMQNAEISGVEYQQGELQGYEVREYLLEKWGRKCTYCGREKVKLEVEHIIPKSRGGSNRVSNLCLACEKCNQAKDNLTAAEFGYPHIQKQAKQPLNDAAAVNATRWALYGCLEATGLPLEVGTGGRTKYNRIKQGYPKAHWIDAACVGASGENVSVPPKLIPLVIKAMGRGNRQMCQTNKYGFPTKYRQRLKQYFGFQTGDIVVAKVTAGKGKGKHTGRVSCSKNGGFRIMTQGNPGRRVGVGYRYCRVLQRSDGYQYQSGMSLTTLLADMPSVAVQNAVSDEVLTADEITLETEAAEIP